MATPASLLDLIARGGSLVGINEANKSQADTALTQAHVPLAQAQVPLTQAQTAREQELARQAQIENKIKEAALRDQEIQRQMITEAGMTPTSTAPGATAPAGQLPAHLTDPRAYYNEALRRGMTIGGANSGAQNLFTLQQNALKLGPDAQAAENALHQGISGSMEGYLQNPTPQGYAALYADISKREPDLVKTMPAPAEGTAPTQKDLAYTIGHIGLVGGLLAHGKTEQEIATAKATQAASEAESQAKTQATQLAAEQAQREQLAREHPEDPAAQQAALTAQQRFEQANKAAERAHQEAQLVELRRHNVSDEGIQRVKAAIEQGRLAQEQLVNGVKYGPGTAEYWAEQLAQNPDSIKELPPEMRSTVGKTFTAKTGLPLPTPLSESAKTQEMASRNALDGISFIRQALKNPEIQAQIGPIMGRLGNVEQAAGTAVGLSPEAEKLAQELRTRMRYFVFQEGKAVLGGRLPQNLMKELENSSANPKMDPAMLEGALSGAEGNAQSVMDNADRQRFGGKMRSREQRGATPAPAAGSVREVHDKAEYDKLPSGAQYMQNGVTYTKK